MTPLDPCLNDDDDDDGDGGGDGRQRTYLTPYTVTTLSECLRSVHEDRPWAVKSNVGFRDLESRGSRTMVQKPSVCVFPESMEDFSYPVYFEYKGGEENEPSSKF